jgi:hypothetical protein
MSAGSALPADYVRYPVRYGRFWRAAIGMNQTKALPECIERRKTPSPFRDSTTGVRSMQERHALRRDVAPATLPKLARVDLSDEIDFKGQ